MSDGEPPKSQPKVRFQDPDNAKINKLNELTLRIMDIERDLGDIKQTIQAIKICLKEWIELLRGMSDSSGSVSSWTTSTTELSSSSSENDDYQPAIPIDGSDSVNDNEK